MSRHLLSRRVRSRRVVRHPIQRRRLPAVDGERGSLTVMTAVLALALLAVAGLVVDGTGRLRAGQQATDAAQQAARAGADALDAATLRAGGPLAVDPAAAAATSREYLAAAGYTGTVAVTGPTTLRVSVTVHRPTAILGLIGIDSYTATGTATADLEHGVAAAENP